MKKAKVLYAAMYLANGGIEKVMINYIENMNRENVEIEFLVISPDSDYYSEYLKNKGFKINRLSPYTGRKEYCARLDEYFKEHKYDVVHIHALGASVGRYAKKNGSRRVIFHAHHANQRSKSLGAILQRLMINKAADYKFACSKEAGEFMYSGAFDVVKNAIDLETYKYNDIYRAEIRAKHGISSDTLLLGNVGRLDKGKNQKFLIDIVGKMSKSDENVKALIVGTAGGDYSEQELRNHAEANGVSDRIIFAGAQSEAYKYYSAFDVFVFPSLFEGLAMVLVEAQSNGVPCVFTEWLPKECKMLDNVRTLPCFDEYIDEWVDTIYSIRNSRIEDTKDILSRNGFDIAQAAEKMEKLYISIANDKKPLKFKNIQ